MTCGNTEYIGGESLLNGKASYIYKYFGDSGGIIGSFSRSCATLERTVATVRSLSIPSTLVRALVTLRAYWLVYGRRAATMVCRRC